MDPLFKKVKHPKESALKGKKDIEIRKSTLHTINRPGLPDDYYKSKEFYKEIIENSTSDFIKVDLNKKYTTKELNNLIISKLNYYLEIRYNDLIIDKNLIEEILKYILKSIFAVGEYPSFDSILEDQQNTDIDIFINHYANWPILLEDLNMLLIPSIKKFEYMYKNFFLKKDDNYIEKHQRKKVPIAITKRNLKVAVNTLQIVKVALEISGCYCAWHEATVGVIYDFTNDKYVGDAYYSKQEIEDIIQGREEIENYDIEEKEALYDSVNYAYYVHF